MSNSESSLIVGIDPGFSGAIAWYDSKNHQLLEVLHLPLRPERAGVLSQSDGLRRKVIDLPELAKWIGASRPPLAIVEHVTASPQMGVTSAFRFGECYGAICGVLAGMNVRIQPVYPAAWKAAVGLTADKGQSLVRACELFPEFAGLFRKDRKSQDLSEAALLAYYGRNFLAGRG